VSYHIICIEVIVICFIDSPTPAPPTKLPGLVHNLSYLRCVSYHVICIEVTVVRFNDTPTPTPPTKLSGLSCMSYHVICTEVTVACFSDLPHPILTSGARIESSLVHNSFCVKKSRTKKDLERKKMDREESKKIGSGEQKDLEREKMINYVRQIYIIAVAYSR